MSAIHKLLTFEIRKEALPQALEATRSFVDEVGRKEGGTASYKAFQDHAHPTRFLHLMTFRTPSADEYHHKTAWRKRYVDGLQPHLVAPPQTHVLSPVEAG